MCGMPLRRPSDPSRAMHYTISISAPLVIRPVAGWLANRSRERSERLAKVGRHARTRTADLLHVKQAL